MIKRLAMVAGTLVLGIAGTGLAATQAWASNSSTSGCVTVYIEYESINATQRRLNWVESRNACGAWNGHFQTGGVNGADTSPVQTHHVNLGGQIVNRGGCIEGVAWRNDGGGRFFELGRTCTLIA
ncbi:hypothetical protein ACI2LF_42635 [Kribbella sp. NPDC020789]